MAYLKTWFDSSANIELTIVVKTNLIKQSSRRLLPDILMNVVSPKLRSSNSIIESFGDRLKTEIFFAVSPRSPLSIDCAYCQPPLFRIYSRKLWDIVRNSPPCHIFHLNVNTFHKFEKAKLLGKICPLFWSRTQANWGRSDHFEGPW